MKDIEYGRAAFSESTVHYMLWSPVVRRSSGKPEYDQFGHLRRLKEEITTRAAVDIELVINAEYLKAVEQLRAYAARETKELKSPIMRFLQIEGWTRKNVAKLSGQALEPPCLTIE